MIRTDKEYKKAIEKLEEEEKILNVQREHFIELGHTGEELDRLMQPLISFHEQLKEEVETYEQMKRGNLGVLMDFNNIGRWLIGIRIAAGLSQKEFAKKTGVSEAQVSRDENNEYHGITVEKAQRLLELLGVRFKAEIEEPPSFLNQKNDDFAYA
ncbi:MAG: helix-turn-helix transcriptional regulator [Gracilimonas sp.]|uniref:helix-turn-helix domain-containing protein n=1 Tax=Gracilimonas sp. TaxID=1974203 RepID=UPI0019ACED7F|nr:helix-turn-helix transcriptional regulator [Gracilimonas sp.]MBD3616706.1 helix-turn-helix transcriptional regulator [Gracilimonas sp.]